jgi:O-antigen/teichoic acid export membrane protein
MRCDQPATGLTSPFPLAAKLVDADALMTAVSKLAGFLRERVQKLLRKDPEVLASLSWLFGERIARLVLGLVAGALVARYLGPSRLGKLNYAVALVALITPFAQLGLLQTVTRELVLRRDQTGLVFGTAIALRLSGAVVAIVGALLACHLLRPGDTSLLLVVTILASRILAETFQVVLNWFESRIMAGQVVRANLVAIAVSFGAKCVVAAMDLGLPAMAAAFAIEPILMATGWVISFRRLNPNPIKLHFDRSYATDLLSRSWPLFLSAFGAVINLKIDQVMLGQMSNDHELGIYAAAAQLSELWFFIPILTMNTVFPRLLDRRKTSALLYKAYLCRLMDIMVGISLTLAIIYQLVGPPLITLLFGAAYAESGIILQIHIWGSIFIFMRGVFSKWLIAESFTLYSLVSQFAGAAVNIGSNLILIPRYGAEGAAFSTVLSYASSGYLALFLSKRARPMGVMMTRSLLLPVRGLLYVVRAARAR